MAGAALGNYLTNRNKPAEEQHHYLANPPTIIDRRETLPNGCYKQVVKAPDSHDPRLFIETEQLICPPGVQQPLLLPSTNQPVQPLAQTPVQTVPVLTGYQQPNVNQQPLLPVQYVVPTTPPAVLNPPSNTNQSEATNLYPNLTIDNNHVVTNFIPVTPSNSNNNVTPPTPHYYHEAIKPPSNVNLPFTSPQQPIDIHQQINNNPPPPQFVPLNPASNVVSPSIHITNPQQPSVSGQQNLNGGPPQVYVLSTKTGIYGKDKKNNAKNLSGSMYLVLVLLSVYFNFI
ncbi:uncharacterized protein isoform X2 [Musca autumnalis]